MRESCIVGTYNKIKKDSYWFRDLLNKKNQKAPT